MFLTVKELSTQLQIKPSTLYAWAAQGRIPSKNLNGLIRFDPDSIREWLNSSTKMPPHASPRSKPIGKLQDIESLIARAKKEVYNPGRGNQTNSEPNGKGEDHGAR